MVEIYRVEIYLDDNVSEGMAGVYKIERGLRYVY